MNLPREVKRLSRWRTTQRLLKRSVKLFFSFETSSDLTKQQLQLKINWQLKHFEQNFWLTGSLVQIRIILIKALGNINGIVSKIWYHSILSTYWNAIRARKRN